MNEKLEGKGCRLVDCDCDNDEKYHIIPHMYHTISTARHPP